MLSRSKLQINSSGDSTRKNLTRLVHSVTNTRMILLLNGDISIRCGTGPSGPR